MAKALGLLLENERASTRRISLVPSESQFSRLAKLPLILDPYHRYFFNDALDPNDWRFAGGRLVAEIETALTLPLLRSLLRTPYVNVRPISGLSAMAVALSALAGAKGETVLSISQDQGGHYATGLLLERLGYRWATLPGLDAFTFDCDAVRESVIKHNPSVIYLDQCHGLFPLPIKPIVEAIVDVPRRPHLHVDISHWLGLVLGGAVPNPLSEGADSVGGSTHKTFPGPQKAILATKSQDVAERFRTAQVAMISSHHFAATLSLGLALLEFAECGGSSYARGVVANARRFATELADLGLAPIRGPLGYSAGHQVWISPQSIGQEAGVAAERLYRCGMLVNFLDDIPNEPLPTLRMGLNEFTWMGHGEAETAELARLFAEAVLQKRSSRAIASDVGALRSRSTFPLRYHAEDHPELKSTVADLLELVAADLR
jgi:glycine/serine hydroxymethyltransferase